MESMRTMTFNRVYDRALMKAYTARIELHSLASEAAYEGMTASYARAIEYWETQRNAADAAVMAIVSLRMRLGLAMDGQVTQA
jgi:hypothetical protein